MGNNFHGASVKTPRGRIPRLRSYDRFAFFVKFRKRDFETAVKPSRLGIGNQSTFMKNENTSFALLTAIIIAGVILACTPSGKSNDATGAHSGLAALTAYVANAGSLPVTSPEDVGGSPRKNQAADRAEPTPGAEQNPSA